ncbi:hypothetical protein QWY75_12070 [Pontixanthobacter aestiaquae]|uniref:hypothetical protein n=1 Tax=Pontixanthobacter aestiaquae TaxID=1509367 RepID=UPI001F157C58|nr:hypothetical protein [Pontixanthobacter aestiaquae]MDN3646940.1 hypothetical protein [Pontixanthobacter aestiaquae]
MKNLLAATLITASVILATPAAAQDDAGDKVNMVIIYGDDECPESTEDVINVCARKAEGERYRIPENLRESDSGENVAWAERVESFETVGSFGTMSCSPTGAGGITGCTDQMIKAAYGEKGESKNIRFGQLIEEARAERLATIDEDAAEEQERVEAIEREYLERLEKERDAPLPGDEGNAAEAEPLPDPNATPEG